MSHSNDHPIAGYLFLALAVGGIGYAGLSAVESSKKLRLEQEEAAATAKIREALAAGETEQFGKAEALLREVLEKQPSNIDALFNLGIALVAQDKNDDADATFQKVLAVKPDDWDAVAERAGLAKRRATKTSTTTLDPKELDAALGLLESIPAGKGNVAERLVRDPLWADLIGHERLIKLFDKHGVPVEARPVDTTLRNVAPEPDASGQPPAEEAGQVKTPAGERPAQGAAPGAGAPHP
ncbi:tetratricopeptide repeat protein [Myxococcota bacterium]|nr:tetratricopeptide repeat protein [Myxococcota bacterium]